MLFSTSDGTYPGSVDGEIRLRSSPFAGQVVLQCPVPLMVGLPTEVAHDVVAVLVGLQVGRHVVHGGRRVHQVQPHQVVGYLALGQPLIQQPLVPVPQAPGILPLLSPQGLQRRGSGGG